MTRVVVADLTHNVVVRSSGTTVGSNNAYIQSLASNATSFSLAYGDFAYLGTFAAGRLGIEIDAGQAAISSSTVRYGYVGIFTNSPANTLTYNNVLANAVDGIVIGSANNTIAANNCYSNSTSGSGWGIVVTGTYNTVYANNVFSNIATTLGDGGIGLDGLDAGPCNNNLIILE